MAQEQHHLNFRIKVREDLSDLPDELERLAKVISIKYKRDVLISLREMRR